MNLAFPTSLKPTTSGHRQFFSGWSFNCHQPIDYYKNFYYSPGYIEVPYVLPSLQVFRIYFYAFLIAPMRFTFLAHLPFSWVCYINQNLVVFVKYRDSVLSEKSLHSSLRSFPLTAGAAAIVVVPTCHESGSSCFGVVYCS